MAFSKRFVVPDLNEDKEVSSAELNSHTRFIAQQKNSPINEIEGNSPIKNSENGQCKNPNEIEKNISKINIPDKVINVQALSEKDPYVNSPQTSFEKAFQNLKQSKYFKQPEIPVPSSSKSEVPNDNQVNREPTESNTNKISRNRSCILVSSSQRGNPILKNIRNVPIQYEDMVPDYLINETTCAIFLSLRYHLLNPNYIHDKLKKLGNQYLLRILLVQVDAKDPHHSIKELTKIAILANCTLLLAWSPEEAGRYLEIYKVFENKPPDLLMERQENSSVGRLVNALTSVKSVNKTDAQTMLSIFKTFKNIVQANKESLSVCPGIGPQKAARLHDVVQEPFLKKQKVEEK